MSLAVETQWYVLGGLDGFDGESLVFVFVDLFHEVLEGRGILDLDEVASLQSHLSTVSEGL